VSAAACVVVVVASTAPDAESTAPATVSAMALVGDVVVGMSGMA
jgi:hypothetical protein